MLIRLRFLLPARPPFSAACSRLPRALAANGEQTPLDLGGDAAGAAAEAGAGGGGLVRTIVGLAVVIGVIYGLTWILRQIKSSREAARPRAPAWRPWPRCRWAPTARCTWCARATSSSSSAPASTASRRSAPTRWPRPARSGCSRTTRPTGDPSPRRRRAAAPRPRRAAPPDGAPMKVDGSNAVEILLLIGGLSLIPAAVFTLTGFTRILIVLGFIRTGLGTPTAPPNQVLVGIALFLTIFVMAPTFDQIKQDAIDPLRAEKISQATAFKRAREADARVHVRPDPRRRTSPLFARSRSSSGPRRGRTSRPTC